MPKIKLLIVTGMSGAGKSITAHSLEDIGFFCIDNFPPILLTKLKELLIKGRIDQTAVLIDLRGGEFFNDFKAALNWLDKCDHIDYQLWFLDSTDQILVRRYKETRRRHPLGPHTSLLESILYERRLLHEFKTKAHRIIDTSNFCPKDLQQVIKDAIFQEFAIEKNQFSVTFLSFGFKHGIPIDADLVFDVRFLSNPYYQKDLRKLNGLVDKVEDYVLGQEKTQLLLNKLTDLFSFLFPNYEQEGKQHVLVAIGCTGGHHRSVAIVEYLQRHFSKNLKVSSVHRDLEKGVD